MERRFAPTRRPTPNKLSPFSRTYGDEDGGRREEIMKQGESIPAAGVKEIRVGSQGQRGGSRSLNSSGSCNPGNSRGEVNDRGTICPPASSKSRMSAVRYAAGSISMLYSPCASGVANGFSVAVSWREPGYGGSKSGRPCGPCVEDGCMGGVFT
jgi:hypothetical protein